MSLVAPEHQALAWLFNGVARRNTHKQGETEPVIQTKGPEAARTRTTANQREMPRYLRKGERHCDRKQGALNIRQQSYVPDDQVNKIAQHNYGYVQAA